jgi:site-specific DNA recombinase
MSGKRVRAEAVLYARVSSKDQEREGFSVPAQLKLLREYADERGIDVVEEFVDVETAKQTGRSGFGRMLAFLRLSQLCKTVLVEKTDRLYRNLRDWVAVDDLGLTIHFVREGGVLAPDARSADKFMHGIRVMVAKNYIDNLSEEVRKGQREKAEQGHWPSVAPVGYVNNLATHRIEVDAVRGPLIRTLFELYADGTYSLKRLVAKAHAIGLVHPQSGQRMMKAQIHRILTNPIYMGTFRWAGKLYAGAHDPLVPRHLFDAVQSVLTRKPRAHFPKQKHPFMGLLTCGRCGCTITAERKKGRYTYYRCTGFRGNCGNTYVREEALADLLGALVERIHVPTEIADAIADELRRSQDDLEGARLTELASLKMRRAGLRKKLDRAYDDYLEGRVTDELWTRRSEEWEGELAIVTAEIARAEAAVPCYVVKGEKILELAKTARFLYSEQDFGERRRLLDSLLSNCTFDRGSLYPTYIKPFDILVKGAETGNWRGRRDSNPRPLA